MHIPFTELPDQARVWLYQSERALTPGEQKIILDAGRRFIDQWVTHGQTLIASITVIDNFFIAIGVDDRNLPSGCSIDSSVDFVRTIGNHLKLDFFGRTNIPLQVDGKVKLMPMVDLKKKLKSNEIGHNTLIYNTLSANIAELKNWVIPLKNSWLARFIPETQEK